MMDTFLDRIDDSANIILTRRFLAVDEDLTTMADNIMFAAENLSTIIADMPNMLDNRKEINRLCQEIKTLENESDVLYGSIYRIRLGVLLVSYESAISHQQSAISYGKTKLKADC